MTGGTAEQAALAQMGVKQHGDTACGTAPDSLTPCSVHSTQQAAVFLTCRPSQLFSLVQEANSASINSKPQVCLLESKPPTPFQLSKFAQPCLN